VREFRLSRLDLTGQVHDITHPGPQVLLTVDGHNTVTDHTEQVISLGRGQSVWIPSTDRKVRINGTGTVFRATDGIAA
jgi:mannose-6-phosphate isomerase